MTRLLGGAKPPGLLSRHGIQSYRAAGIQWPEGDSFRRSVPNPDIIRLSGRRNRLGVVMCVPITYKLQGDSILWTGSQLSASSAPVQRVGFRLATAVSAHSSGVVHSRLISRFSRAYIRGIDGILSRRSQELYTVTSDAGCSPYTD